MKQKRTPMLEQYFAIKEQHKDAVLFFQMGDFYEMFGDDAVETAKILDLTLTARQKGTANEIAMCGVPIHAGPGYLAKLTNAGKKVAICEQVTLPCGNGLVKREVTRIVTPGTTFDDSVLNQKRANYLAAVTTDGKDYGFGVIDVTTGHFQIGLLSGENELLEEFFRLSPSEIIGNDISKELIDRLGRYAYVSEYRLLSWQDRKSIVTGHFSTLGIENFGLEQSPLLIDAAAMILAYIKETQKTDLGHIRSIELYRPRDFMLLDEATIRNLEIFSNQHTGQIKGSLADTIDLTTTSMGARLLNWWLAHPLTKQDQIEQRLEAVDLFVKQNSVRDAVRILLDSMGDLERLVGKVGTGRVNPRDLYNLKETIKIVPELKNLLSPHQNISLMKDLDSKLFIHQDLIIKIEQVLIDEPPVLLQNGGYIKDGYNTELDEIRNISRSGKEWISNLQEQERQRTGINSLKIKFNQVFGYYLEISRANLKSVPNDYIRKQTLVNAERFITPELKEYEEKVLGAQEKMLQLEEEIFNRLKKDVFEHLATLQETAKSLAQIDVLSSFAQLAVTRNYCRPVAVKGNILDIKQGHHPVIQHLQKNPYIANDLNLDDKQTFILLTGPNMSGKSSYLRQNALIVFLAQIGCFVPAKSMSWSLVDRIFTRVGASDNLAQGRSTFMVEMQEAAYILNNATENSLVVLDELGRGTSTYDGLSLAWAISEYLHQTIRAKTLFATHYHELIEVIDGLERARNFSVAVVEDGEEIVFLHQVQKGGVNRSYGIEVGKLAGLPAHLIVRAKDLLAKLEKHAWEKSGRIGQASLPMMPVKTEEHPVLKKLKNIDPDNLTPMQALELIIELKKDTE